MIDDFNDRYYCIHCAREVAYNTDGYLFARFGLGSSHCERSPSKRHSTTIYDIPDLSNPDRVEEWLST